MADEVYLELIERGVEHWNRWREEHPDSLPDLSGAYLFEAELSGINLRGANLNRACLIGANLKAANLYQANLQNLYGSKINLEGANLSEATLNKANLSESQLANTTLSYVKAAGTNLSAATLTGACIEDWQIDTKTNLADIVCDHLYQKQPRKDRYPESGSFNPETFAQFIQRYRTESDIDIPDGLDIAIASSPAIRRPASSSPSALTSLETSLLTALPPAVKKRLTASQISLSLNQWRLVTGAGVVGLLIIFAILVNLIFRLIFPRQTIPDVLLLGPNVNLESLPCNEPAPPNLRNLDPDHVYASGVEFYGQFENGLPVDGPGIMKFPNGDRYDGEFKLGRRDGCGTFSFASGRQYMGQFKNDQFHGVGIWRLEGNERYIGQFEENKCEGWGTFIFADGSSKSGTWEDGDLVGDQLSCNRGVSSEPEKTVP
ncbi:MAG: hypothetical protein F6K42_29030 [Leptolyngbya sp. SIO1D8]|nr:hypothetical protein [Leptolyngbya sp. SIO1D8]